jgi:hypothetical protein
MTGAFHDGEIEAQRRAGVRELADRVGRTISGSVPVAAAAFLARRSFVVAATIGPEGQPHGSILGGPPGFVLATSREQVELRPESGHVDDVIADLSHSRAIGILAIDFTTRRRMRVNGEAESAGGTIVVSPEQVYSNCSRFIRERADALPLMECLSETADSLDDDQVRFVGSTDTFFIVSAAHGGADASHRGGTTGFIETTARSLRWTDFQGNNLFNTVGNLLVEPRCTLLFADFTTGAAFRVEGRATVEWNGEARAITVAVERVKS